MSERAKVGVIGLGYIGLPTAVMLATHGMDVHGVDVRQDAIELISKGRAHIHEPGLNELLEKCVKSGHLRASLKPVPCDAFILAVPTPFKGDHLPDMSHVEAAAASIAPVLRSGNLVILESTSPVGATDALARQLAKARPDLRFPIDGTLAHDVHVVHCPERVLPGQIFQELVDNSRVVGGIFPCCAERAVELYKVFVRGDFLTTNARSAELVKLSENAFRDVNIAFANELSIIADRLDIDVQELIRLANLHPRVNILNPGAGVGGHCLAVDPWFIVSSAPEQAKLIHTARLINDAKPKWVVEKIMQAMQTVREPCVACLGLSYKPDVDDLRESPAIAVIENLLAAGVQPILVHDPYIQTLPPEIQKSAVKMSELEALLQKANILVLLTNHQQYHRLNALDFAGKIIIDPSGAFRRSRVF